MATTIAKAVVGSKVKSMTKGIEDAVGGDEKKNKAEAEAESQRAREIKQEMRSREKKELHNQKEAERQDIRAKYQLPPKSDANKPAANNITTKKQTESSNEDNDKGCTVC